MLQIYHRHFLSLEQVDEAIAVLQAHQAKECSPKKWRGLSGQQQLLFFC